MNEIIKIFDIRHSTDYIGADEYIRKNVYFKHENAWALICSIFIASIGLNVNSTAVIIGAMLISPLMGPIIGAGYALAVEDLNLFKISIKSFLSFVLISLVTSTVFFSLSPFTQAQSELLSRTQPTIYDLLIATFGGIVGIIALTRLEKGNAIPGVAIATALMPPLCTVGYGISQLDFKFFLGAGYLFIINVFFISLSTFVIVRFLNFRLHIYGESHNKKKINYGVYVLVAFISLPSIGVAWYLKQKTTFESRVERFVQSEIIEKNIIISRKVETFSLDKSRLVLYTFGRMIDENLKKELHERLKYYDLKNTDMSIFDVMSLNQLEKKSLGKSGSELDALKIRLATLEEELEKNRLEKQFEVTIENDLKIINHKIKHVLIRYKNNEKLAFVYEEDRSNKNVRKIVMEFLKSRKISEVVFLN